MSHIHRKCADLYYADPEGVIIEGLDPGSDTWRPVPEPLQFFLTARYRAIDATGNVIAETPALEGETAK